MSTDHAAPFVQRPAAVRMRTPGPEDVPALHPPACTHPSVHARARRFYERRGWQRHGFLEVSPLGLPVTEYRRPQSPPTTHRECP